MDIFSPIATFYDAPNSIFVVMFNLLGNVQLVYSKVGVQSVSLNYLTSFFIDISLWKRHCRSEFCFGTPPSWEYMLPTITKRTHRHSGDSWLLLSGHFGTQCSLQKFIDAYLIGLLNWMILTINNFVLLQDACIIAHIDFGWASRLNNLQWLAK